MRLAKASAWARRSRLDPQTLGGAQARSETEYQGGGCYYSRDPTPRADGNSTCT